MEKGKVFKSTTGATFEVTNTFDIGFSECKSQYGLVVVSNKFLNSLEAVN
jgi:hypothetical protein